MSLGLDNLSSRYVYRVLRPDEDPHEDLSCKDSSSKRSLAEHVETGLRIPSRYISTTVSFEKAKQWLETADERTSRRYRNKRTTIVRIDISEIKSRYPQIANSAFDLTRASNRNYFLNNDTQKKFTGAYEEVVFVICIPSEVVTTVHVEGHRIRQDPFISPPPQHSFFVPLHTNIETRNSFPVSAPSLLWRHDSNTETDNAIQISMTYGPYTDCSIHMNSIPSMDTYGPYTDCSIHMNSIPSMDTYGPYTDCSIHMNSIPSMETYGSYTDSSIHMNSIAAINTNGSYTDSSIHMNSILPMDTNEPYRDRYTQSTSPESTTNDSPHSAIMIFLVWCIILILLIVCLSALLPFWPYFYCFALIAAASFFFSY